MRLNLAVRDERTWHRASARVMGSVAEMLVDGEPAHIAMGFDRLRQLERSWTRFDPDSELNQFCRSAGRWTTLSDDLFRALDWCRRLYAETGGIYDPTIRDSLESLGYDRTFADVCDEDREPPAPRPAPGFAAVELTAQDRCARLLPGVTIDLGGVGKGLAADIVASDLLAAGARSAYVSVGGDIHAAGVAPDGSSWPVPLLHPQNATVFATHALASGGLVMSTVAIRHWRRGSQALHHIIDPRTGLPSNGDLVAVAVAARSAARAEALAKSALVLGTADGALLLERADVTAWLIDRHGALTIIEETCSP